MSLFKDIDKLCHSKGNFSLWFPKMLNYVGNTCPLGEAGQKFIGATRDAEQVYLVSLTRPHDDDLTDKGYPKFAREVPPKGSSGITAAAAFPLHHHQRTPSPGDDATTWR